MHVLMERLVMSSIIDIKNNVLMEIGVMSSIISVENSVCSA